MSATALDALLRAAPPSSRSATLPEYLRTIARFDGDFEGSIDRATLAGYHADRLGFAFAGGYRAALGRLVPELGTRSACLCATEEGGGHPRAMKTTLDLPHGTLRGTKTFATLATVADDLLVVASIGESDGKNELRVVRVARDTPGVVVEERPPWPVAPEVPHAIVRLDVTVDESAVLPGDGYDRYLKPFRTIEDAHVLAAASGHLLGVGRAAAWDRSVLEALASSLMALRAIGAADPSQIGTHVALAGTIDALERLFRDLDFGSCPPEVRERWLRDAPLLAIAGKARAARREAAWRKVAGG